MFAEADRENRRLSGLSDRQDFHSGDIASLFVLHHKFRPTMLFQKDQVQPGTREHARSGNRVYFRS
jgi:hypothetical protein